MANNKFSDLLQCIQNTQIRIAIDRMFKMIGLAGTDTEDGTPNLSVDVTGDITGSSTVLNIDSVPVNAVASAGELTVDTIAANTETITIGTTVYTFVTSGASAEGEINIGINTAASQTNFLAAIDGSDGWNTVNPDVTASAFASNISTLTAIVKGVIGDTIVTTTTMAGGTNAFDAGTLGTAVAGVDGTVGAIGTYYIDSVNMYIAKAANTIADANWRQIPMASLGGASATAPAWDTFTTTTVDGGDGTATVQLIFKDTLGVTIAVPVAGTFYISKVATGLDRDVVSGYVTTLTNGVVQYTDAQTLSKCNFTTTAAGLLGMTLGSGVDSYWLVFQKPDGSLAISDEIVITSGG